MSYARLKTIFFNQQKTKKTFLLLSDTEIGKFVNFSFFRYLEWILTAEEVILKEDRTTEEEKAAIMEARRRAANKKLKQASKQQSTETEEDFEEDEDEMEEEYVDEGGTVEDEFGKSIFFHSHAFLKLH